jgi:tRNA nucleotidyltransferase (CCA-adding enzyme)
MNTPIELLPTVAEIIELLTRSGYDAYAVGGCVRDSLMGRTPHDWDVCSSATPEQLKYVLGEHYRIIPTGEKYGTLTVISGETAVEVTTFRGDGVYSDGRRPDSVRFSANVADDLLRRDFTMNAVAYNPEEGIIDPFGGVADIRSGVIRAVGSARERFAEDALRIIRACRFASELGFTLESDTASATAELAPLLSNVSDERVSAELIKLLLGQNAERVILEHWQVLTAVVPPLAPLYKLPQNTKYHFTDAYTHTAKTVAATPPVPELRMAALLHDVGKARCATVDSNGVSHFYGHPDVSAELSAELFKHKLRFSRRFVERVLLLVRNHAFSIHTAATPASVRSWLNKVGEPAFRQLLELSDADAAAHAEPARISRQAKVEHLRELLEQTLSSGACYRLDMLAIGGDELIAADFSPGAALGNLLDALLCAVIDGKCANEPEALLRYAKLISNP